MKTKGYIQITGECEVFWRIRLEALILGFHLPSGYIDQTVLGLTKDDLGGELDPHG